MLTFLPIIIPLPRRRRAVVAIGLLIRNDMVQVPNVVSPPHNHLRSVVQELPLLAGRDILSHCPSPFQLSSIVMNARSIGVGWSRRCCRDHLGVTSSLHDLVDQPATPALLLDDLFETVDAKVHVVSVVQHTRLVDVN
jgi:hypothetical protein